MFYHFTKMILNLLKSLLKSVLWIWTSLTSLKVVTKFSFRLETCSFCCCHICLKKTLTSKAAKSDSKITIPICYSKSVSCSVVNVLHRYDTFPKWVIMHQKWTYFWVKRWGSKSWCTASFPHPLKKLCSLQVHFHFCWGISGFSNSRKFLRHE